MARRLWNWIKGVGSVVIVIPPTASSTRAAVDTSVLSVPDLDALRNDWISVGRDISAAMDQLTEDLESDVQTQPES